MAHGEIFGVDELCKAGGHREIHDGKSVRVLARCATRQTWQNSGVSPLKRRVNHKSSVTNSLTHVFFADGLGRCQARLESALVSKVQPNEERNLLFKFYLLSELAPLQLTQGGALRR